MPARRFSLPACTASGVHRAEARQHAGQCVIKIPATVRTGKTHPYTLTATENLGTGFLTAPASATTVNPEKIYFR